jgi:Asp-tRNA(Asn)/Glu-tRNA(Gln) amidotransferase C subunit
MTVKKDALKEILDDLDSVLGLFDSVKEVATKKAKSEVRWNEQDKPKL